VDIPSPLSPPNCKALQKVKGNQFKGRNAPTKGPIIRAYYIYTRPNHPKKKKKEKKVPNAFGKAKPSQSWG
jgi:hypothetical protein